MLVIGPPRVGKTTLISLLEERLLEQASEQMKRDPGFIPFASITTAGPDASRFDWRTYYRAVLRGLNDPFVDGKIARIRERELREAMESALLHRKPIAVNQFPSSRVFSGEQNCMLFFHDANISMWIENDVKRFSRPFLTAEKNRLEYTR